MRIVLGLLMIVHGIAHLVGFAGSFGLSRDIPFKTTVLGGHVDVGLLGTRALGVLWLACALAFLGVGTGAIIRTGWWQSYAIFVGAISLALCLVELPAAKIGAVVDVVVLAAILVGRQHGWFA